MSNSNTIGFLAAHGLILRADRACKKTAEAFKDIGVQLKVQWNPGAPWSYLQALCEAAKPPIQDLGTMSIASLAEGQIHHRMNACLQDLVRRTEPLKIYVENGAERWTQYEEGLITESEYLNGLIDAVSRHKGI
jgi:hypothetical protein